MQLDELRAGQKLRVTKSFLDFDHQKIEEGSEWTFENYTYFPYDGGYTFYFKEGVIRMAEISPEDYHVFQNAGEYFTLLD